MSEKETGGPAFPFKFAHSNNEYISGEDGMDLRDYFAAKAMQALITKGEQIAVHTEKGTLLLPARQGIPGLAYEYADAMLEARK